MWCRSRKAAAAPSPADRAGAVTAICHRRKAPAGLCAGPPAAGAWSAGNRMVLSIEAPRERGFLFWRDLSDQGEHDHQRRDAEIFGGEYQVRQLSDQAAAPEQSADRARRVLEIKHART